MHTFLIVIPVFFRMHAPLICSPCVFRMHTCLICSPCVFQDIYIHRFFRYCHQAEGRLQNASSVRGNENSSLEGLRKSIKDLDKSQEEPLVRFLHLIIDKLLMLLVRPPMAAAAVGKGSSFAFKCFQRDAE